MKKQRRSLRVQPRHVLWGALGLALALLVISGTGATYLSTRRPELALTLVPDEPQSLVQIAQGRMDAHLRQQRAHLEKRGNQTAATSQPARPVADDAAISSGRASGSTAGAVTARQGEPVAQHASIEPAEAELIADPARRALHKAPLDAAALRLLAQIADATGDTENKQKLLAAIVRRTKHEPLAGYWLMMNAMERKDYATVARMADIVLTRNPELTKFVAPYLVQMLETKTGDAELKELLRTRPVWRAHFFVEMMPVISDARTPLNVILALKGSPRPAEVAEVRHTLAFLTGKKFYEIAYYTWLQTLEPEALKRVALVNNGDFEAALTKMPFDWLVPSSPGASVDIRPASGANGKALYVAFEQGRVDLQPVHQTTVLAPGRYRLELRQRGEITGRRGLQWRVHCVDGDGVLALTPMFLGRVEPWTEVQVEFAVPDTGCRAQWVSLILAARSASEQLVKGAAWFDDVRIVRHPSQRND